MGTQTSHKKVNHKAVVLSFMADIPTVFAGLMIGAAVAVHYEPIDVIPMFTLTTFIFYTLVVITWRLIGINKRYRFFTKLSNQLLYCEAVFLIAIYLFNLYYDATYFPIASLDS